MKFQAQHSDYETYDHSVYHLSQVPTGFSSALNGFIIRYADNSNKLQAVCNDIAAIIPTTPTTNWGWTWLLEDFSDLTPKLCKGKFHKLMDFIGGFVCEYCDGEGIDSVNELLSEHNIGYYLTKDRIDGALWELADNLSVRAATVEETQKEIKDVCKQALEHLQQARHHLQEPHSDRDRKDAVRDCLSATEALLKHLSGQSDIKDATAHLRLTGDWGPDIILKDGLSVWNRMHELYPDIRHGQSTTSSMTDEEALFWIDRLNAFIRYIARQQRIIDKGTKSP